MFSKGYLLKKQRDFKKYIYSSGNNDLITLYNKVVDFLFDNDMLTNDAIIIKESNEKLEEDQRFLKHKGYRYGTINVLIERR